MTFIFIRRTRQVAVGVCILAAGGALGCLMCGAARAQLPSIIAPAVPRTRTISLSFYNADAADVLRAVSLQSGISIAIGASVRGKLVTLRLQRVTVEEALRLVTEAASVGYRRIGAAYLVGTSEELRRNGSAGPAAAYVLKNIPPAAAKTLVEGALPYVTVQTAPGVSAIVITGLEQDVLQAQRLLVSADVPLPASPPSSVIVTPTNVTAPFLAEVLGRAVPDATFEVKGNALIVLGPKETVDRVSALVPTVDVAGGAGRRVEIYTIRYSSAASLAAMLASAVPGVRATPSAEPFAPPPASFQPLTGGSLGGGFGSLTTGATATGSAALAAGIPGTASGAGGGASGATDGAFSFKSRALILAGSEADVDEALRLLQAVDIAPLQVEIEARIVDLSLDSVLNAGIQWGTFQTQGGTGGATTQTFVQGTTQNQVQELNVPDIIRFGRFRRTPFNLAAQLQFLETKGISKTLANPRISVIDNEEASIFIGDVLRFQVLALTSATAGQSFTVQEVPVGIALLTRPRVNDNGDITLKVKPVVSTLTNLVNGIPQTASREADSTLRIKDGETIVIGGLIRDQEIKSVQEVPLLAKIPLFGELFRNRSNRKQRSEVLIFLTPRLLKDNGAARAADALSTLPTLARPAPAQPTTPKETPKR